jgi:hypothetical protein
MPTLEEVRQKIKRNFPKDEVPKGNSDLRWNRETALTIVDSRGFYRICKQVTDDGVENWTCWTLPWGSVKNEKIAGPFRTAKEARDACQAYHNGEPMQASL